MPYHEPATSGVFECKNGRSTSTEKGGIKNRMSFNNNIPPMPNLPDELSEIEYMNRLIHRISSGGPSIARLLLLIKVAEGAKSKKELANLLGVSQPTCSGHLEKLSNFNLIKETRERKIIINPDTIRYVIAFLERYLLNPVPVAPVVTNTTNKGEV